MASKFNSHYSPIGASNATFHVPTSAVVPHPLPTPMCQASTRPVQILFRCQETLWLSTYSIKSLSTPDDLVARTVQSSPTMYETNMDWALAVSQAQCQGEGRKNGIKHTCECEGHSQQVWTKLWTMFYREGKGRSQLRGRPRGTWSNLPPEP